MTNYEQRKAWRVKLNNARIRDQDHSSKRYRRDAKVLNRAMRMHKIDGPTATWGA
jgi:hypothetical protein